jgi:hypothetical protein
MSERGYEAIVGIAIFPRWVRLYFGNGKSLPDPKGLLEGSGAKVRSVTLKAASDLDHRDIRALIKAPIKHTGVSFPRTRSIRLVIKSGSTKQSKSVSKKQRPRRTGHA